MFAEPFHLEAPAPDRDASTVEEAERSQALIIVDAQHLPLCWTRSADAACLIVNALNGFDEGRG